jgi:acylphosphatase
MAFRYLVRGRVQGVGFRFFTARVARSLGLAGFVRNLPNGDVEVEADGTPDALRDFEQQLNSGPAFSDVTHVEREPIARVDGLDFRIR